MKKIIKNKYFLIGFITPLVIVGGAVYAYWSMLTRLDSQYEQGVKDGYEIGRFDQLNEDAETTQKEIKEKKETNKKQILLKLSQIESYGGKVRKLLDTNNKYSLGLYHFQASTVQDMYKRYYNKKISITKAVEIAQDDELSTRLAYDAIFIKKELYHWHNSMIKMNKLGLITYDK